MNSKSLFVMLLCGSLWAAPAPLEKKSPHPPHVGQWTMTWGRSEPMPVTFSKEGCYICVWESGEIWVGSWKLSKDKKTLTVREWKQNNGMKPPPYVSEWSVALRKNGRSGKLTSGGDFRLIEVLKGED